MDFITQHLEETIKIVEAIEKSQIKSLVSIIRETREKKGRIFFLGAGGSAANASHAVNDFRKLCNIESYAPTDNVSELSARVNDEGWESVFLEWLKVSNLNDNDLLFIFSVGGGNKEKSVSVNLIHAIDYAKKIKSKIVGIVGRDGGYTFKNSNACVLIPNVNNDSVTPHSEAFQAVIWHLIISHPDLKVNRTKW
tara:strand:- start:2330 stop:2914 length:585 start_codon:yes stop_codon:yes gene_type:complete